MEKVSSIKPETELSSPTKVASVPKNDGGKDYSYYRSTAELMPKAQSKR